MLNLDTKNARDWMRQGKEVFDRYRPGSAGVDGWRVHRSYASFVEGVACGAACDRTGITRDNHEILD